MKKVYLGDSVYAEFNGFQIILTTENGMGATNTIFLEDSIFENVKAYGDAAFKERKDQLKRVEGEK